MSSDTFLRDTFGPDIFPPDAFSGDDCQLLAGARVELLQSLWSGYGSIKRYVFAPDMCSTGMPSSVVVKQVQLPQEVSHPRGWNTALSHQRKIRSYQVESAWYRSFAKDCNEQCRIARCWHLENTETEWRMVLEDLDAAGFCQRHQSLDAGQMLPCLHWLAHFHATFTGYSPLAQEHNRLWPVGSYWHLGTRPDELAALDDLPLKQAAPAIDRRLSQCRYQTLVHGDAKLANFCFSEDGKSVAAVDFQYTGGGCGIKDVAYFIGSCLHSEDCADNESFLLNAYFDELRWALAFHHPDVDSAALEAEWRGLYPWAWADFYRFLKGWSPGHWKIHSYGEKLCGDVLLTLS